RNLPSLPISLPRIKVLFLAVVVGPSFSQVFRLLPLLSYTSLIMTDGKPKKSKVFFPSSSTSSSVSAFFSHGPKKWSENGSISKAKLRTFKQIIMFMEVGTTVFFFLVFNNGCLVIFVSYGNSKGLKSQVFKPEKKRGWFL
ncbi:hypothetical protein Gotur_019119, partial [Gossypium turneri]